MTLSNAEPFGQSISAIVVKSASLH